MIRLIIWGIIFYIGYQLFKFFSRVNSAINKANQPGAYTKATQQQPKPQQPKNLDNIIEVDFVEIKPNVNKEETK